MDNKNNNKNSLVQEIDNIRNNIDSDKMDMSFKEIRDMCKTGELIINPDFQRTFRWKVDKCSRFLESLLLKMPVPPIFFIELSEGKYELIDGLQRICSYLAFVGDFQDNQKIDKILSDKNNYKLVGCEFIKGLNGKKYNDLDSATQFRLNRANIRINILRERTKQELQYSMFNRLNTGGEPLSDQEIRNSSIRVLGNDFVDFIIKLSNYESYQICMKKAPKDIKEKMGTEELILRILALKNNIIDYKNDLSPFLTRYMEKVTKKELPFDYGNEEKQFKKVFDLLNTVLGEQVFITKKKRFAKYYFEAFSLALYDFVDIIDKNKPKDIDKLKSLLLAAKDDKDFNKLIGKEYQHKKEDVIARKAIITCLLKEKFEKP
jgi:hypothetical protein